MADLPAYIFQKVGKEVKQIARIKLKKQINKQKMKKISIFVLQQGIQKMT